MMKTYEIANLIALKQHRLERGVESKKFGSTLMAAYRIVTLHKLVKKAHDVNRKAEWDVTEEQVGRWIDLYTLSMSHDIDSITFEEFIKAVIDDREF